MLGTHVKHISLFFSGKIAPEIKLLKMYESQMWLFTTTLFFIFIFHSRLFNAAMPICGMVMMMISDNLPCLAQYQWRWFEAIAFNVFLGLFLTSWEKTFLHIILFPTKYTTRAMLPRAERNVSRSLDSTLWFLSYIYFFRCNRHMKVEYGVKNR